jgi:hypothetical protein
MSIFPSSANTPKYGGAEFLLKKPFRTAYFISNTVLFLSVLLEIIVVLLHYWGLLVPLARFLLFGVGFGLITFWTGVLRVHRAYHGLLTSGRTPPPESGSLADLALGTVASLIFQSLLSTCETRNVVRNGSRRSP